MPDGPVVILGAGGFIGRALAARLAGRGVVVRAVLRRPAPLPAGAEAHVLGTITAATDWTAALAGSRSLAHLASRAHVPPAADEAAWIDAESRAGAHLARAAARAGLRRIVLLSSVKVHGEASGEHPFRADRPLAPEDAYGRAKQRLEAAMRDAAAEAGIGLAVLRPPLVYGPGVKANFRALMAAVARGLPLPLGSVGNRRSLVYLENLLDLVEVALDHPAAAGGAFLVRDDEEVSTAELVRRIARRLGRRPRLLPCPPALLRLGARALGRGAAAERLLGSLQVDDRPTRDALGWRPRFTLDEGLAETCRAFRAESSSTISPDGGSRL